LKAGRHESSIGSISLRRPKIEHEVADVCFGIAYEDRFIVKRNAWVLALVGFAVLVALVLSVRAFIRIPSGDGASIAANAADAATQFASYLDDVAKSGGRPDYSKPPASDW